MAHYHSYNLEDDYEEDSGENYYYQLEEDFEEDSGAHPEQGTAAEAGGSFHEGTLSLGPEGDHGGQEPLDWDPEVLALQPAEVPRPQRRRPKIQFHFTQWQVQEMETVFQETQYPDVLTRRVLAGNMSVPEAKVQMWFNNRRARQRAREKKALLRSSPPGVQEHICIQEVEEP